MNNKIVIAAPNPIYECLCFLERSKRSYLDFAGDTYEELYESLQKKHLFDEKTLRKKIRAALSLQKKVLKAITLTEEEETFYFAEYHDSQGTIARDLFSAYVDFTITDIDACKENGLHRIEQYGNRAFQMMCGCDESTFENEAALEETFDFIGFLRDQKEMHSEDKWNMIEVHADVRYHFLHLFEALEPGIRIITQELQQYTTLIEPFQAYIQGIVDKEIQAGRSIGIQTFCEDAYLQEENNRVPITIIPCLAELNAIGWLQRKLFLKSGRIFFIGILMDDSYHKENHLSAREELLQNLRLLSDNSKFEIMKLLRKKSMYGQEIGEHLKLSKATISHHVNVLNAANFLAVKEEKQRIYYTINEDYLRHFLKRLEEELLED